MEYLSKIAEWIKLKPLYIVAGLLTSGALLFLPANWLTSLGLKGFADAQKGWVGLAFLLSLALLIAHVGDWSFKKIQIVRANKQQVKDLLDMLKSLTPSEKGVLKRFMDQGEKSITLGMQDSTVSGLERQGFITRGPVGNAAVWPYMLQPCVWHHLKDHPELLEGAIEVNTSPFM